MACIWTDYVGVTEDCVACENDDLYIEDYISYQEGATQYWGQVPNTGSEYYIESEFVIPVSNAFTFMLDADYSGLISFGIHLDYYDYPDDLNGPIYGAITDVVQVDELFAHTVNFINDTEGVLKRIVVNESLENDLFIYGIGLPNGEIRIFCSPLFFSSAFS